MHGFRYRGVPFALFVWMIMGAVWGGLPVAARGAGGVVWGTSVARRINACEAARQEAHRVRCPHDALEKEVEPCSCRYESGRWLCSVRYSAQCRDVFIPQFVRTGTTRANSSVSESMACANARHLATVPRCREFALERNIESCRCEALGDRSWSCLVDYSIWCRTRR